LICDSVEPTSRVNSCGEYNANSRRLRAVDPLWDNEGRRTGEFIYELPIDHMTILATIGPLVGAGIALIGLLFG
jgi:hypothetical protein